MFDQILILVSFFWIHIFKIFIFILSLFKGTLKLSFFMLKLLNLFQQFIWLLTMLLYSLCLFHNFSMGLTPFILRHQILDLLFNVRISAVPQKHHLLLHVLDLAILNSQFLFEWFRFFVDCSRFSEFSLDFFDNRSPLPDLFFFLLHLFIQILILASKLLYNRLLLRKLILYIGHLLRISERIFRPHSLFKQMPQSHALIHISSQL